MYDVKYDEINESICSNRYLDKFGYTAAKILAELETRAVSAGATIVGGSFHNVYWRNEPCQQGQYKMKLPRAPSSYLIYLLNGYHCAIYLDSTQFWMFDGSQIHIEKLDKTGCYHRCHYPTNFAIHLYLKANSPPTLDKNNIETFYAACLDPAKTCDKQEYIVAKTDSDRAYVNQIMHVEPRFYLF